MSLEFEAVVVGAGPAGLTAATYLARFRRRVLVLDGGPSRATWIPESHNTPGFPQGVGGDELLRRLRDQAEAFGVVIEAGRVGDIGGTDGAFVLETADQRIDAATVLLATGVVDRLPGIEGIEAAILASVARICPICDAFEAIDRRIAVLADGPLGDREVRFLQTYSQDVTLLSLETARGDGGAVRLEDLLFDGGQLAVRRTGVPETRYDHLYLALGCASQTELAIRLGARQDESGSLLVDSRQMTTVEGLYAAGDVVRGLNQIAVAAGEAAIAATAMHNRMCRA